MDNRLVVTRDGRTSEETLGDQASYTYQLAWLADALRDGQPFPAYMDGSVANAELIDKSYRRACLSPCYVAAMNVNHRKSPRSQ